MALQTVVAAVIKLLMVMMAVIAAFKLLSLSVTVPNLQYRFLELTLSKSLKVTTVFTPIK